MSAETDSIADGPTRTSAVPPAPWVRRITAIISRGCSRHHDTQITKAVVAVLQRAWERDRQITDGIAVHQARLILSQAACP